jgi:hypothetical protein
LWFVSCFPHRPDQFETINIVVAQPAMKSIEIKTTESKVHAVTVFQADRAEIVRLCTVDLEVTAL